MSSYASTAQYKLSKGRIAIIKTVIQTPAGPVAVHGHESAVTYVYFYRAGGGGEANIAKPPAAEHQRSGGNRAPASEIRYLTAEGALPGHIPTPIRAAVLQLQQYFDGIRHQFDFPMDVSGTPFQRAVWDYLLTIPYGKTQTYGEVAAAIGKPTAARAVGTAVGNNPISIAIPCHRVVAAGGGLGGYGGGLSVKRRLLRLEGVLGWPA